MILLRCSNCGQTLEIDDAFAGGVCRCRHCGTIQAVPADAPRAGSGAEATGSRPLYRREEAQESPSSGLDQLADVVAGSGMLSSGLGRTARRGGKGGNRAGKPLRASDANRAAAAAKKPADKRLAVAVGLAAVLFVAAAGLTITLLTRDARPSAAAPAADATFAGLPLGRRVVFVLDRGEQTQPSLRALDAAVLQTVDTLPPTAQFQVVYWANVNVGGDLTASPVVALPGQNLRDANQANRDALRKGMAEVVSGGSTDALPALDLALRNDPETIILVTGKAWQLTGDFAAKVLARARDRGAVPTIHTVAVGSTSDGPGEPLNTIAAETGGRFIGLTTNQLRDLAR